MQRLFVYIDETGQDTLGELFLVSVIITQNDRDNIRKRLEEIECVTKKGRRKWLKTREKQKVAYIRRILKVSGLKGSIYYAEYHQTTDYLPCTVLTTARAITLYAKEKYKASVFVDGLPKTQTKWFGAELRHLRVRTEKVRGVRKESADVFMRLADAIAGFVRDAIFGNRSAADLLEKAKVGGFIREL
ncbi:MAG: hypothetical protein FJ044_03140 [Candidatus Cloacimonetes bacterium]|nr:hypothetical protein [Candidatus Cloacimonadota bacterium]